MITKTRAFTTTDGQIFTSIELAQRHELIVFLNGSELPSNFNRENLADLLLSKKDQIVDLLTMKAGSHPKARKVNGGKRTPKIKPLDSPSISERLPKSLSPRNITAPEAA